MKLLAALAALTLLCAACQPSPPRLYADTAAWNTPVPTNPAINPASATLVPLLTTKVVAQIYTDSTHIYAADAPTYNVTCTEPWGTCPLTHDPVPIPDDATPSPSDDHSMTVIDPATHIEYDFWGAAKTNGQWSAKWGAVEDTHSDGRAGLFGGTGGVGAGVATLAGRTTIAQLNAGTIDHALGFATSLSCSTFVFPATKSDGHHAAPCLPEGSRIQLDPAINVDAIPNITPFEKMVGHALQTYGAINDDVGGSTLGLTFESPLPGSGPYPALGVPGDYWNMPHIPWGSIRVLHPEGA